MPETVSPPFLAANALPVILRDRSEAGMEALISGRLFRRGPCLYLDTGNSSLILWADTISIARSGEAGWSLTDQTTGEQFREGDWLQGGGGHY